MNNEMVSHVRTDTMGALVQSINGKFKQVHNGDLDYLMTGYDYVLVEKELARVIESLEIKGVKLSPVTISVVEANSENKEYFQMFVANEFSSDDIESLPIEEDQFFLMDKKYLFATPSLVQKLKELELGLEFSLGLSDFG